MKTLSINRRLAASSAVLAVAAASVALATPAQAAPVNTDYTCSAPGLFTATFPVSVNLALLPATAPAGFPLPAGLLGYTSTVSIPANVASALATYGVNGGKSDNFSTAFGEQSIPAPVAWTSSTTNADGSVTFSGKGANSAATLPKASTYSVTMPKTFTLTPTTNGSALPVAVSCTSATPSQLGTVTLTKQATTTKAKATKSLKAGQTEKVKVTVANEYAKTGGAAVSGIVTVKDGKKKVGKATVKNGKATVTVKKLAVGSHKLTVAYSGDDFSSASKAKAITVTVKK